MGVFLKPILDNVYRGQRMFGPQGRSLFDLPSSSKSSQGSKSFKDKNDNNNSDRVIDEESEERRLKIEKLLKETLQRYAEEENK